MQEPVKDKQKTNTFIQFLVLFVIPLIILTRFSGESQLGPVRAFLSALALPIAYEAFNLLNRKKLSILSLVAIVGILITGAISLLGLSEEWLAIRRAVPYLGASVILLVSLAIKRPLVDLALPYVLDMESINARVKKKEASELKIILKRTGYMLSALLLIIAVSSYILTKLIIQSATDTSEFNQEYAELRLLSLPFTSLPLIVGFTGILYYLVTSIERVTSLSFDQILKKR